MQLIVYFADDENWRDRESDRSQSNYRASTRGRGGYRGRGRGRTTAVRGGFRQRTDYTGYQIDYIPVIVFEIGIICRRSKLDKLDFHMMNIFIGKIDNICDNSINSRTEIFLIYNCII